MPSSNGSAAFLRCWTRKEAYVKALGEGLTHPLADFDVSVGASEAALLAVRNVPWRAADWGLLDFDLGPWAIAALAWWRGSEHPWRPS